MMVQGVLNQFRRIYADHGYGDRDFSEQEGRLHASLQNLKCATDALMRASERLQAAAADVATRYNGTIKSVIAKTKKNG